MNEFTFTFSEDDWVRVAARLSRRIVQWFWLGAAILALFAICTMESYVDLITPAVVLAALAGCWLFTKRRLRRIYREQPSLGDTKAVRLLPDHIEVESRIGVTRLPWNEIIKWNVIGGDFYLYVSRAMTIPIPKTVGPENLALLRDHLVESGLGKPRKRRK